MDQQQLTPEQKRAVTRARFILWIGIIGIIAIGTLVAVYFVFLRQGGEPAVNNSNRPDSNINVATNTEQIVTVSDAVASPDNFNNKNICLSGYYSAGFESSILVPMDKVTVLADGTKNIDQMNWRDFTVWIGKSVPSIGSDCDMPVDNNGVQDRICSKETVICGTFSVASSGTTGFGHLGAYRFMLE